MTTPGIPPGVTLHGGIEERPDRRLRFRARVRWTDPVTGMRHSKSEAFSAEEHATAWVDQMRRLALGGVHPGTATMTLAEYGEAVMPLALRGLEAKTLDPYLSGWRRRVVPSLGHLTPRMITNGAVDRAAGGWIADECSRSTMDPRSLALPDWDTLIRLADALVARSADQHGGWGDVTVFAACTAARIGEVSGCRVGDIDTRTWVWTVRRQTTPSPGGLVDKGTKGKRARVVPLIADVRELVARRIATADGRPDARLYTGPRGGRITTAVLRDATHWDEVVSSLGLEHLRRHALRHTGLTWMADAGVPVHVLRVIAGHGSLTTTQRYLHPDRRTITDAGEALTAYLRTPRSPSGPQPEAM